MFETKESEVAVMGIVPVPGVPFEETLAEASTDALREMVRGFAQAMKYAEAGAACRAAYGEVSPDPGQSPQRVPAPGTVHPGMIGLVIPRLRHGSYYPEWLLERRRH